MKFQQPHSLPKEEALRRIEKLTRHWQTKHGVNVTWTGDSARLVGTVSGISFDAKVVVAERQVDAEGTDPGMLVRAMATAYFKKKLADYLDPRKSLEDLERQA
jgi:hypothetical protein